MISNTKALEIVGTLSSLSRFPTNPFALAAIAKILREHCQTDAEGDRLASAMLARFDQWPGPSTLRSMCEREIALKRPRPKVENCLLCTPTGDPGMRFAFKVDSELVIPEPGWTAWSSKRQQLRARGAVTVYEVLTPCTCPAGVQYREQEAASNGRTQSATSPTP